MAVAGLLRSSFVHGAQVLRCFADQRVAELDQPVIELKGFMNRRGNVTIEVCDNGPGIPAEMMKKIFVPFFTTKEKGSGVGLALARQVMTAHDGFIRVNENDGGGARFTLTF